MGVRVFGVAVIMGMAVLMRVAVPMRMIMPMGMSVTMRMAMSMRMRMIVIMGTMGNRLQSAFAGAKIRAEIAGLNVGAGRRCALTFNMEMMAFLDRANLIFKANDRRAIFAQNAGRRGNGAGRDMIFSGL